MRFGSRGASFVVRPPPDMQMRARHTLHPENTKLGLAGGHDVPSSHRCVQAETQILPRLSRRNDTVVLAKDTR